MKKIVAVLVLVSVGVGAQAQAPATSRGYNPNSVRPIHESNIMFKRTVWRYMDLREKQNKPFMAENNEVTRAIFEGVKSGQITAYTSDSLTTTKTISQFTSDISDPGLVMDPQTRMEEVQRIQDDAFLTEEEKRREIAKINDTASAVAEYPPSRFNLMEIKEDIIFDKQRSRLYYDIQAITILMPTETQDKPVLTVKYKELAKYFRTNPRAIWFNERNNQAHLNLADAFDLRLFSSRIFKLSNPDNRDLEAIYEGVRGGLIASQQQEYQLMEFEHNLWEF